MYLVLYNLLPSPCVAPGGSIFSNLVEEQLTNDFEFCSPSLCVAEQVFFLSKFVKNTQKQAESLFALNYVLLERAGVGAGIGGGHLKDCEL